MAITEHEFQVIIANEAKRIEGDISWVEDEDHSPTRELRSEILSDEGYPLFIAGKFNYPAGKLSYSLIHRGSGRIYGICLGYDHHNPTCEMVGDKHKHYWTDQYRDKMAYVPEDITEVWSRPLEVWRQFCNEANLQHFGTMNLPPNEHAGLLL